MYDINCLKNQTSFYAESDYSISLFRFKRRKLVSEGATVGIPYHMMVLFLLNNDCVCACIPGDHRITF